MQQFSIEAFISDVERLGLRLSATRLADGKIRLNRWRMPDAVINAQRIEDLWAVQIGESRERLEELARHVLKLTRPPAGLARLRGTAQGLA
jgi:hypothetical protein